METRRYYLDVEETFEREKTFCGRTDKATKTEGLSSTDHFLLYLLNSDF